MNLWLRMVGSAARILKRLTEHGFQALRCVADGEIVVSSLLVLEVSDVVQAARETAPFYPHIQRLEVYGVRSSPSGAITKRVVRFVAQLVPLEEPFQVQERLSA